MSAVEDFHSTLVEVCSAEGWNLTGGPTDCEVEVKLDDGRRQVVACDPFSFEGQELSRLCTIIGKTTKIPATRLADALRVNYGLPHGALAVRKDDLVMVDTLLMADVDPAEIRATVRYLAETGDHFERTMFGPDEH